MNDLAAFTTILAAAVHVTRQVTYLEREESLVDEQNAFGHVHKYYTNVDVDGILRVSNVLTRRPSSF